jgi:predicted DNA-binding protein (UPF0251 family)/DNA-directed RNA polymerase subunit RPC12/RpoP
MSPRPKRHRKINEPPFITGFVPENGDFDPNDSITLFFEEYEALKLADYKGLSQLEASSILEVSRPTFTRIYTSARKKIAQAMVEHKRIRIAGGDVVFDEKWYVCRECETVFKLTSENDAVTCPVCQSENVIEIQNAEFSPDFQRGRGGRGRHFRGMGQTGNCVCPKCNYTVAHQPGVPCNSNLCPECNIRLVRENSTHHLNILKKRKF